MYRDLAFALRSALASGNTWLALQQAELGVEFAHAQLTRALPLYLRGVFKTRSCVNVVCTGKEHSVESGDLKTMSGSAIHWLRGF